MKTKNRRKSSVRFEPVQLPRLSHEEREAIANENFTPEQRASLAKHRAHVRSLNRAITKSQQQRARARR